PAERRQTASPLRPVGAPAARDRRAARHADHRDGARPLRAPAPEHLQSRGRAPVRAAGLSSARRRRALHALDGHDPRKDRDMTTNVHGTAHLQAIAPQLLVDDLDAAIAYYRDRLGFAVDFVYDSFYAGVSRGGVLIHLKHAPRRSATGRTARSTSTSTRTWPSRASRRCTRSCSRAARGSPSPSGRGRGATRTSTSKTPTATSSASARRSPEAQASHPSRYARARVNSASRSRARSRRGRGRAPS